MIEGKITRISGPIVLPKGLTAAVCTMLLM